MFSRDVYSQVVGSRCKEKKKQPRPSVNIFQALNLEPGTSSSSVKTVKDRSELLAIHKFFPTSLTEYDFVCLSLDGV